MRPTLTALYLVKNESEFLPLSVATVIHQCDEVVIIDNESTDGSNEIGRKLQEDNPGKVRFLEMAGDFDTNCEYVNRNKALKEVHTDWVMTLDADQLISDDWYKWIKRPMSEEKYDAIRFRYEHLVGSYEYIHKEFLEKQQNPALHPHVPLWQTCLWRMRPDLEFKPAMISDKRFKEFHHASPDLSMAGRQFYNSKVVTLFHYGFCKKNMMEMSIYRIQRGDYGHDRDKKDRMISELKESDNPFRFVGGVVRVKYGPEIVPSVMKKKFGNTYRLTFYQNSINIKQRYSVATGEPV